VGQRDPATRLNAQLENIIVAATTNEGGEVSSKTYPVRLSGHGLISEGAPRFRSTSCEINPECREYAAKLAAGETELGDRMEGSRYSDGHAHCSCGAESPHLPSGGRRKQWHKDHKRQIAAATTD
jgi:hypothetical protein